MSDVKVELIVVGPRMNIESLHWNPGHHVSPISVYAVVVDVEDNVEVVLEGFRIQKKRLQTHIPGTVMSVDSCDVVASWRGVFCDERGTGDLIARAGIEELNESDNETRVTWQSPPRRLESDK